MAEGHEVVTVPLKDQADVALFPDELRAGAWRSCTQPAPGVKPWPLTAPSSPSYGFQFKLAR